MRLNKISFILSGFVLLFNFCGFTQEKKKIDHTTYDEWKTIRTVAFSANADYIAYELTVIEGDAKLVFQNLKTNQIINFERSKNVHFLNDDKALVFAVEPQHDSIRQLKLDKTPKEKLPKDSLFIYLIEADSVIRFADLKSYQFAEDGQTIAWLNHKDLRPDCPENPTKKQKKKNPCSKPPTSGQTLTFYDPFTGYKKEFHCVTNYSLSLDGTKLLYTTSHKGKSDTLSLYLFNLSDSTVYELLNYQFAIQSLTFDKAGNQLAFLASTDTNKNKNFTLYHSGINSGLPVIIADSTTKGMPEGYNVSEFGRIFFSEKGDRLYFGINEIVRQEPKDTLLENEKAKVDVWGANDERIQPVQLESLSRDLKKTYSAVYFVGEKNIIQLGSEKVPNVSINSKSSAEWCYGSSDLPYQRESSWEYPWKSDYYLINQLTGETKELKKGLGFRTSFSPSGEYFIYYNGLDSNWYAINTSNNSEYVLTEKCNDVFASDNNGNPSLADEEGFISWTLINEQEYAMVKSRHHIWALNLANPNGNILLTQKEKYQNTKKFEYYRSDTDSLYTTIDENYFIAIDEKTKSESICTITISGQNSTVTEVFSTPHKIVYLKKAENSDALLIRRMSFTKYPDIELTDVSFKELKQISDANPQQSQYNWGTVEFVEWESFKGINLRGLLYKPENFDSTKTYPMIVYFYEKYTDQFHNYYSPKPTASIIHPTEYVSSGYIVFIPDIIYEPGQPANSAYDCIVSGTDYLTKKHQWIDSTRMGLQGQSWGGYQTAMLITMTNKYKAAMAGAPVSNMISAYGGIRWGSGYSRMFQYERTQSRIGYTIWERPDLYIANSPLYHLPKVQTPLLIMSNDGDGAVPWYQGIELYMGLRRLDKPVWMLNYNGDEHNLMQTANRRDLSVRMKQFFDYYLMGSPMPVWMSEGIPATEKGKSFGLELQTSP